jgi:ATP-dependent exoDNAse (exonuclease V) alpha subunit
VRSLRDKSKAKSKAMAIYHLSIKAISRSAGRSATAAAAYRAGCKIADERTGEIHDYTRKGGVESTDIVLPDHAPEWAKERAKLWNAAELAETRKNSCVAREIEVALPHELPAEERRKLAVDFARDMANREGCAVDVAIHAPSDKHDNLNHHAHILRTTRKVEPEGLGEKLDTEKAGRNRKDDLEAVRARWAEMTNAALERNGIAARVDHRSLADQGIEREPTQHRGVAIDGMQRRGADSFVLQRQAAERLERAAKAGELERAQRKTEGLILDLSSSLSSAKAEQKKQVAQQRPAVADLDAGKAAAAAWFEQQKQIEAGKQQVASAFDQWKAEQHATQQRAEQERQRTADELARQLRDAEAKKQAEQQKAAEKQAAPPKKEKDSGPSFGR